MDVNYLAVLLAAVAAFILGGIWYSPALFAKKWLAYTGRGTGEQDPGPVPLIFGGAFLLALVAALVFAIFLGPDRGLAFGTEAGFAAGLGWVGTSLGIGYLFERRPFGLWLINAGYHVLQFTLYGAILGAMG